MNMRCTLWTMTAAAVVLAGSSMATGQTASESKDEAKVTEPAPKPAATPAPSSRKMKSVRKPVVDLQALAKERRPGQVMPGDPAPVVQSPAAAAASPGGNAMTGGMEASSLPGANQDAPKGSAISLPDTAPGNRNIMKPVTEENGRATAEAAPAPAMTTEVAPAPAPAPATAPAPAPAPAPAAAEAVPVAAAAVPAATVTDLPMRLSGQHAEPLPQMEMPKDEAPSAKVADAKPAALDAGAGLVDGSIVPNIPMALSTSAGKIRVVSIAGDSSGVQWRVPGEAWKTPTASETVESKIEVRNGLDSDLTLVVDDRVQLRVSRLGRVVVERSQEAGGTTAVYITLSRGALEVRPVKDAGLTPNEMFARVRTPDQMFGVTGALRVEYQAFTGTRRRTINP
jgi:hypothetical protein